MSDFDVRFGGIARLFGAEALQKLRQSHVAIVGVGGVGSWAVEALARSGVGRLTLIDLDEVCVSNVNRQLPALNGAVGRPKVDVLAERAQLINPEIQLDPRVEFFTESTAKHLLDNGYHHVIDAIDHLTHKALLIALCHQKNIPVVVTGGAGGRRDPAAIRFADLSRSSHDRLLQKVRKKLRKEYGFPEDQRTPFGIECVYSPEPPVYPSINGDVCGAKTPGADLRLTCDTGYGTAAFVTGAFGFAAAARVVHALAAAK